jgi:sortase A
VTRKRGIAVLSAFAVALAGAVTTAAVLRDDGEVDDSPLLVAPPTTDSPTTRTATTTTVKLPVPIDPPADPYAATPIVEIGTIELPKVGMVHKLYEGITLTVIDHGPGHWPGSAMPCELGNAVFPGHRVTHSRPFYDLDKLAPGDRIVFRMNNGRECVYEVTGTQIVQPTDLWVVDQSAAKTTTLIACHPKGSAAQRIVVKGKLVSAKKRAAA